MDGEHIRLQGERVVLRKPAAADLAALVTVMTDPTVAVWWGTWDAARVQAEIIDPPEDDSDVVLVIEVAGEVAGIIQFYEEADVQYKHAAVDISLGSAWQGQGIGREAIRTVVRHLFEERGHHRITIDPALSNTNAIRAYTAVGFRPVGVMREYEQGADGTYHDGLLMDFLRTEFR